jgi:predicted RNase H-like HicB family nuclease
MTYGILFEKVAPGELPDGYYYAHVPTLGLTTHGLGVEGARAAARDLLHLWLEEKKANGETTPPPTELLLSTLDVA